MPEDHENTRRDWRLPDELWERIVPLLPPRKLPPLGCHRPRVRIGRRWMPFSSCSALVASGTR